MSSEQMGLVSARTLETGLNQSPQLIFHNTFTCAPGPPPQPPPSRVVTGDPGPKTTRELIGHHYFNQATDFRRQMFDGDGGQRRNGSEEDDDVDDDEDDDVDDDEDDVEVEGIVRDENSKKDNSNSDSKVNNSGKIVVSEKSKSLSTFGAKEGNAEQTRNDGNVDTRNAVTIASVDGDMYYCSHQYVQGIEGSNAAQKEMGFENGCGFSGRKEGSYSSESGESLRVILSDPITGALMDDAMILPCGHSFGTGGVQHAIRMKACYICSQAVSEDSVAPNLSLRAAVQAFRREEESQLNRSKRRRERYDQDRGTFGDLALSDLQRGRGVQFPFAVTDRVIIKGNKRTPPRFVGREAVVTTQCLNGWYVVKTLDNAESVKLQYRSLAKVPDNLLTQPMSSKTVANWL